jgi:hypothetical protein
MGGCGGVRMTRRGWSAKRRFGARKQGERRSAKAGTKGAECNEFCHAAQRSAQAQCSFKLPLSRLKSCHGQPEGMSGIIHAELVRGCSSANSFREAGYTPRTGDGISQRLRIVHGAGTSTEWAPKPSMKSCVFAGNFRK